MSVRSITLKDVTSTKENFLNAKRSVGREQFIKEEERFKEFSHNVFTGFESIVDRLVEIKALPSAGRDKFLTLSVFRFLGYGVVAFEEFKRIRNLNMNDRLDELITYVKEFIVSDSEGMFVNGLYSEELRKNKRLELNMYKEAMGSNKDFTADNGLLIMNEDTLFKTLWSDFIVVNYMRVWMYRKWNIMFNDNTLLSMLIVADDQLSENDRKVIVDKIGGRIYYGKVDDNNVDQLLVKFVDDDGEKLLETGIYSYEDLLSDLIDSYYNTYLFSIAPRSIDEYINDLKEAGNTAINSADDVKAYYAANPSEGYFDDKYVYRLVACLGFDDSIDRESTDEDFRQDMLNNLSVVVEGTQLTYGNAEIAIYDRVVFLSVMANVNEV